MNRQNWFGAEVVWGDKREASVCRERRSNDLGPTRVFERFLEPAALHLSFGMMQAMAQRVHNLHRRIHRTPWRSTSIFMRRSTVSGTAKTSSDTPRSPSIGRWLVDRTTFVCYSFITAGAHFRRRNMKTNRNNLGDRHSDGSSDSYGFSGYTGHQVFDDRGERIGQVTDVIYDPTNDVIGDPLISPTPSWLVVDPGVLRAAHYVPVAGSSSINRRRHCCSVGQGVDQVCAKSPGRSSLEPY